MPISGPRCDGCGIPDVITVAPVREEDRTQLFVLRAGRPDHTWCQKCFCIPKPSVVEEIGQL
jgi:hypothetical protein